MNHGSLYSGIGGWLLAARWAGIENVFTCEIEDFPNKILDKHFPNTDRHYDIKETDFTKYEGSIDILSTSDPCQPFSFAGKRGGKADDRYLWPQTIRVIREIKPSYVVFENVPGFISLGFETVASDLEAEGYTVESFVIPACSVGAWHRRDRLWIVAYREGKFSTTKYKHEFSTTEQGEFRRKNSSDGVITNTNDTKTSRHKQHSREIHGITEPEGFNNISSEWWAVEPNVGRVVYGLPDILDRLKSLGNSIVPQIAYLIFEAIKEYDRSPKKHK